MVGDGKVVGSAIISSSSNGTSSSSISSRSIKRNQEEGEVYADVAVLVKIEATIQIEVCVQVKVPAIPFPIATPMCVCVFPVVVLGTFLLSIIVLFLLFTLIINAAAADVDAVAA